MLIEKLGRCHTVVYFKIYLLYGHEPGSLGLISLLVKWG